MKKSKSIAIASFVFGLTFWIPLINLIFGLLAIYLGIKALKLIKKEPGEYAGKGFAIAGIVLGIMPIIFYIASLLLCLMEYKEICKNVGLSFLSILTDKIY